MPLTAKLSRKFYETFGDDIANELVDWFNIRWMRPTAPSCGN